LVCLYIGEGNWKNERNEGTPSNNILTARRGKPFRLGLYKKKSKTNPNGVNLASEERSPNTKG